MNKKICRSQFIMRVKPAFMRVLGEVARQAGMDKSAFVRKTVLDAARRIVEQNIASGALAADTMLLKILKVGEEEMLADTLEALSAAE